MTKKQILIIILIFCVAFFSYRRIYENLNNKANHIITKTVLNMNNYHVLHSAILLKNGNVLIIGGREGYDNTEIYNPNWKYFKILKKQVLFGICSANLLKNGHVIIGGGKGIVDFEPNKNLFSIKNDFFRKNLHKSLLLNDERLFICGGYDLSLKKISNSCQIYDPKTNKLNVIGELKNVNKNDNVNILQSYNAILLPDNNVLIMYNDSLELYNPKLNKWYNYKKIKNKNISISSVLLINNKIFLVYRLEKDKKNYVRFGYYDINTNIINQINTNITLIGEFEITPLPNKNLLFTGVALDDTEGNNKGIYLFNTKNNNINYLGNMKFSRMRHQSTLLKDNKTILITGGATTKHITDCIKTAELLTLE